MESPPSLKLAGLIALLSVSSLAAQSSAPKPAKLLGLVRVEGSREPIADAEIMIAQTGPVTTSDARGLFRLDSVAPGERRLIVRKIGFAPLDAVWSFAPGDSIIRIIELSKIQTLDTLVTVEKQLRDPEMDDFAMHKKLGLGHFYMRDEIDRSGGRISNLLATTNGVQIRYGLGTAAYVGSSRGPKSIGGGCLADVYLDAVKQPPPFDVNTIHPDQIEAIEYYAGAAQTPAKYMRLGISCGVLVIHTRRL